jgi:class 3 adenylate cyclase
VLRVGINLGDMVVEGGNLYGDGVNIAARLEALLVAYFCPRRSSATSAERSRSDLKVLASTI